MKEPWPATRIGCAPGPQRSSLALHNPVRVQYMVPCKDSSRDLQSDDVLREQPGTMPAGSCVSPVRGFGDVMVRDPVDALPVPAAGQSSVTV